MVEQAIVLVEKKRRVFLAIGLAVMVAGYLFMTQSVRSTTPDHGDWWSDMIQVLFARNFNTYGFSELGFGTERDNGLDIGLPPAFYIRWPSFPAVVLGYLYSLGFSTATARIVPLLFSCSAIIAVYLLTRRMVGDWRAGIAASLALAASTPFRLLSDSFAYPSYDFAAETWTMLFITLGTLAAGRKQLAWLAAASASALATITLSGFEMVPAIALYAVFCPLFFAQSTSEGSERLRVSMLSALLIGFAFILGMSLRVAHNAWLLGDLRPALDDFEEWFFRRSGSSFQFTWNVGYLPVLANDPLIYYITVLANRALNYFPFHFLVIVLGLAVGGMLVGSHQRTLGGHPFRWLAIVFLSDVMWFVFFREHTHEHVHTIYHLSLTISIAFALAFMLLWQLVGRSFLGNALIAVAGVAALGASMANVGVQPWGNLQIQMDWTAQQQKVEEIASLTPPDAIIVIDMGNLDPSWQLFLDRAFIRRPGVRILNEQPNRPWYLLTQPIPTDRVYIDALAWNHLIRMSDEYALFDMKAGTSHTNWGDSPE